jgi:hypothetical protein
MSAFSLAWSGASFYPAWKSDPWSPPDTGEGTGCTADWLNDTSITWLNGPCSDWLSLSEAFSMSLTEGTTTGHLNTIL